MSLLSESHFKTSCLDQTLIILSASNIFFADISWSLEIGKNIQKEKHFSHFLQTRVDDKELTIFLIEWLELDGEV